jgi:hypothetical protein
VSKAKIKIFFRPGGLHSLDQFHALPSS